MTISFTFKLDSVKMEQFLIFNDRVKNLTKTSIDCEIKGRTLDERFLHS